MKQYPAKKKKQRPKEPSRRFDKSQLTEEHLELLKAFKNRRGYFEQLLEESNIIYHKETCPGCGFPTLDERGQYQICVICLWEDDGKDDNQDAFIGYVNPLSLVQHRVNVASFLQEFEKRYILSDSIDEVCRSIKVFEEKLENEQEKVDTVDFENNLKKIIPVKEK
ncbi:MAG: hypothetical protein MI810_02080 [Flavobacteriales bacterium]|nr:hypothetical protein [Flavobacteriales bacterium]